MTTHSTLSRRALLAGLGAAMPLRGLFAAGAPPNVLLITADDMNCDAPGCFGGRVPGITPNIDRLAAQGLKFGRAHVTVAVCQPSRSVLMTGRYPHRNGAEGFNPIRRDVPTLQERLRDAGYLNGIMAKVPHLAPIEKFCWDLVVKAEELMNGRDPAGYGRRAAEFFAKAKSSRKPFFLMANSQDPHRPFAGSDLEIKAFGQHIPVRRTIPPPEAVVPGFLPDIPDVRREVAQYYTSVYRCDETVGAVLDALAGSGLENNTLVMFLSDNGMSFPFSKTNCYLNSTKTPWIVRWPGRVKPRATDSKHYISGIDFMPTVLDAAGLEIVPGMDGSSFRPLLEGKTMTGRDEVVTVFHETSARQRYEMRAVQDGKLAYIFNPWSDGKRIFRNESQAGLSFKAMQAAAEADKAIAERVRLFLYREVEELYDLDKDPNALHNLAGQSAMRPALEKMRERLGAWMKAKQDPAEAGFLQRFHA